MLADHQYDHGCKTNKQLVVFNCSCSASPSSFQIVAAFPSVDVGLVLQYFHPCFKLLLLNFHLLILVLLGTSACGIPSQFLWTVPQARIPRVPTLSRSIVYRNYPCRHECFCQRQVSTGPDILCGSIPSAA